MALFLKERFHRKQAKARLWRAYRWRNFVFAKKTFTNWKKSFFVHTTRRLWKDKTSDIFSFLLFFFFFFTYFTSLRTTNNTQVRDNLTLNKLEVHENKTFFCAVHVECKNTGRSRLIIPTISARESHQGQAPFYCCRNDAASSSISCCISADVYPLQARTERKFIILVTIHVQSMERTVPNFWSLTVWRALCNCNSIRAGQKFQAESPWKLTNDDQPFPCTSQRCVYQLLISQKAQVLALPVGCGLDVHITLFLAANCAQNHVIVFRAWKIENTQNPCKFHPWIVFQAGTALWRKHLPPPWRWLSVLVRFMEQGPRHTLALGDRQHVKICGGFLHESSANVPALSQIRSQHNNVLGAHVGSQRQLHHYFHLKWKDAFTWTTQKRSLFFFFPQSLMSAKIWGDFVIRVLPSAGWFTWRWQKCPALRNWMIATYHRVNLFSIGKRHVESLWCGSSASFLLSRDVDKRNGFIFAIGPDF